MTSFDSASIAHVIQLAVAPVFLLSGVGIFLTVLTNRLARLVDRARQVEEIAKSAPVTELKEHKENLRILARRARLMNRAITMSTICALLVSLMVATLFMSAFFSFNLATYIGVMFILAMVSLIGALVLFLREVFLAISSLHIGIDREIG